MFLSTTKCRLLRTELGPIWALRAHAENPPEYLGPAPPAAGGPVLKLDQ